MVIDFKKIDQLKERLDSQRPLPQAAVRNLKEVYRVEWTYHSNAMEGNTLSLIETKVVLEEGLTIGGKKLREHFEVVNHGEAISYIEDLVNKKVELNERVLKDIHYLVLKNIDNENAGKYRRINVGISGSKHQTTHFLKVEDEMRDFFAWYNENKDTHHPVYLAAQLHFKFVYIHPFVDGNGRTARLLMNFILMSFGFPPAIIKADGEKRLEYYESLEKASVEGELFPFVSLISECVVDSLQRYLNVVE